jgi:hypothetical protein
MLAPERWREHKQLKAAIKRADYLQSRLTTSEQERERLEAALREALDVIKPLQEWMLQDVLGEGRHHRPSELQAAEALLLKHGRL